MSNDQALTLLGQLQLADQIEKLRDALQYELTHDRKVWFSVSAPFHMPQEVLTKAYGKYVEIIQYWLKYVQRAYDDIHKRHLMVGEYSDKLGSIIGGYKVSERITFIENGMTLSVVLDDAKVALGIYVGIESIWTIAVGQALDIQKEESGMLMQELNKVAITQLELLSDALLKELRKDKDDIINESPYQISSRLKNAAYNEYTRIIKDQQGLVSEALKLAKDFPNEYEQSVTEISYREIGEEELELVFKHANGKILVRALKVQEAVSIDGNSKTGLIENVTFVEALNINTITVNGVLLWFAVVRTILKD